MQQYQENEGLQVNHNEEQAAKAPEFAGYYANGTGNDGYYTPPGYQAAAPAAAGQKIPFGLGVWTFGALIAILTAIIVGAGVGGGLGAALANSNSESCSAATAAPLETSQPTATECATPETTDTNNTSADNDTAPYVPRPAKSVKLLELDCPTDKTKQTSFKSSKGYDFKWWCGVNAAANTPAEEGGMVADVSPIIAYTLDDCINACSAMIEKDEKEGTGVKCRSIVFGKRMSAELESWGVNCWLKNATKERGGEWGFKDDWYAYAELDE